MNINTDQLVQRIEFGITLLKSGLLDAAQQQKVLVTISALTREHAKQLDVKEAEHEAQ